MLWKAHSDADFQNNPKVTFIKSKMAIFKNHRKFGDARRKNL